MSEKDKIVYDPTIEKSGKKAPKKPADEALHEKEAKDEAKPEKTTFINKYGFLHINSKVAEHLGLEFGKDTGRKVPVTIELIEGGFILRLA